MSRNSQDDSLGDKSEAKRTVVKSKKRQPHLSKLTASRFRRNRDREYPPAIKLKKPGPARKFYLNAQHVDLQARIDLQRQAGLTLDVTRDELVLARSIIPKERFAEEPDLIGLAFVPYRYWSAWQRTEHFAREFDSIYREYQLSRFAETIPAPSRERLSLWPDSDINALWRARQHADCLGVPYRFYIRQAFKYRFATGYKRCPKPGQLWHGDKILDFIEEEFNRDGGVVARREYKPASLQPMFLAENYCGERVQRAAHADLYRKSRQFPDSFKLLNLLKGDKIIPEIPAREHFGDLLVDRALVSAPYSVRQDVVPLSPEQKPTIGCFGNFGSHASECSTCPIVTDCQALQAEVDVLLAAKHGSADPVRQEVANAATLRKRNQRARDRLDRKSASKEAEAGAAGSGAGSIPTEVPKQTP